MTTDAADRDERSRTQPDGQATGGWTTRAKRALLGSGKDHLPGMWPSGFLPWALPLVLKREIIQRRMQADPIGSGGY